MISSWIYPGIICDSSITTSQHFRARFQASRVDTNRVPEHILILSCESFTDKPAAAAEEPMGSLKALSFFSVAFSMSHFSQSSELESQSATADILVLSTAGNQSSSPTPSPSESCIALLTKQQQSWTSEERRPRIDTSLIPLQHFQVCNT